MYRDTHQSRRDNTIKLAFHQCHRLMRQWHIKENDHNGSLEFLFFPPKNPLIPASEGFVSRPLDAGTHTNNQQNQRNYKTTN